MAMDVGHSWYIIYYRGLYYIKFNVCRTSRNLFFSKIRYRLALRTKNYSKTVITCYVRTLNDYVTLCGGTLLS